MAPPTYQNLIDENQRLREENRQLRMRVDPLETQVRKLTALLEQAQRTGKRQAAPFSKGTPKQAPKTPGRKPGANYGPKVHRRLPEQEPDEIIDVRLPDQRPDCGGLAEEDHVDQQSQVEIPRQPLVRRFDIHVGRCRRCGRRRLGRHPLQTSNAAGAAASQLGPDLQALIALMKDKYGLSYGDIQGLLDEAFGISVSRGGAAQVVLRVAERHEPAYEAIRQIVRRSDIVYPDMEATSWPAEQAVRPLVVNRKVFGGNRPPPGGHTQEVLGSVFATLAKRALDTLSFVSHIICSPAAQRPGLIHQLLPAPPNCPINPLNRYARFMASPPRFQQHAQAKPNASDHAHRT